MFRIVIVLLVLALVLGSIYIAVSLGQDEAKKQLRPEVANSSWVKIFLVAAGAITLALCVFGLFSIFLNIAQ